MAGVCFETRFVRNPRVQSFSRRSMISQGAGPCVSAWALYIVSTPLSEYGHVFSFALKLVSSLTKQCGLFINEWCGSVGPPQMGKLDWTYTGCLENR